MIRRLLLSLLFFALSIPSFYAQTNRAFHYQAVARDNGGAILSNSQINLRFQIRANSPSGTLVYQEKHTPNTNNLGLVSLDIGKGLIESGDFNTIAWNEDDYYLIVELNGVTLDTTLFEAVPYAKVATDMRLNHLRDVSDLPPFNDQVLAWDGSAWIPKDEKSYTGGTGINVVGNVITNEAPDQSVSLTGNGATSVSGSYPNFTISSTDNVNDADASTTNEIQSMSLSGNTLSLSLGGGSVNLASFGSPWNNSGSNLYFNTGKVGIGDNSPVATLTVGNGDKFQVHGSDGDIVLKDDQGSLRFANSNGSNSPMIHMFQSGTNNSTRMLVAHSPNFSSWGIQYNDTADAFNFIGDNQPIMQVQLSGQKRIGISTQAPSSKVHIVHESNLSDAHLKMTETQYDYSRIRMDNDIFSNFWDIAARTDTNLANAKLNFFHSNEGDLMTIRGDGRVGINDASPGYPLEINGDQRRRVINVYNTLPTTSTSTFNYGLRVSLSQSSNTGFPRLINVYGSSTDADSYISYGVYGAASNASLANYGVYGITSTSGGYAGYFSGNVFTTGSYLPSDERLKTQIAPLQSGLPTILQLKPKQYRYEHEKFDFMNLEEGDQFGFIAQEIESLLPNLVKDSFQPFDEVTTDSEDGQGYSFKAINYTGLIPIMVSAMQEQQEVIETQEARIKNLEDRLNQLEALLKK
ncbi:MAG: tail fiber domain-containing protein [Bacteroidota bacterium]